MSRQVQLFAVVRSNDVELANTLLSNGANSNAVDSGQAAFTPSHYAARLGSVDMMKLLIDFNANIHQEDNVGCTPLHYGVQSDNVEMVWLFIRHGADFQRQNIEGNTVLHYAARSGKPVIVELLLAKTTAAADINKRTTKTGATPLHCACMSGSVETAEVLINHGADLQALNMHHETVLFSALHSVSVSFDMIELLVRNGIDISIRNQLGKTALASLIDKIHYKDSTIIDIIRFLLAHADVNERNEEGKTLLHCLIDQMKMYCQVYEQKFKGTHIIMDRSVFIFLDVLKTLIECGADVNARDNDGNTPLDIVERSRAWYTSKPGSRKDKLMREVVRVLSVSPVPVLFVKKDNGQSKTKKSTIPKPIPIPIPKPIPKLSLKDGRLFSAVRKGDVHLARTLLQDGANPNAVERGRFGYTPSHYAARSGKVDMMKLLKEFNADIHHEDRIGCTPLHYGVQSGNVEMVVFFTSHAANMQEQNKEGYTILHYAARSGKQEVVEFLLNETTAANDINRKTAQSGVTPLHSASMSGSVETAEVLINNGANLQAVDKFNQTVLFSAISSVTVSFDMIKLLVENGVDVTKRNQSGKTALFVLIDRIHYQERSVVKVIRYLLNNGVDVNEQDENGRHALHHLADQMKFYSQVYEQKYNESYIIMDRSLFVFLDVLNVLIKCGADVQARDNNGQTPLNIVQQVNQQGNRANRLMRDVVSALSHSQIGNTPLNVFQQSKLRYTSDPLISKADHTQGIEVFDSITFQVCGDQPQTFCWEGYGFELHIPEDSSKQNCYIRVEVAIGGDFVFPRTTEPMSPVFIITIKGVTLKGVFYKPILLKIQHCVYLKNSTDCKKLSFYRAPLKEPKPPFHFKKIKGGNFFVDNDYGELELHSFCAMAVCKNYSTESDYEQSSEDSDDSYMEHDGLNPKDEHIDTSIRYFGKVFYQLNGINSWHMKFIVVKNLLAFLKYVQDNLSTYESDVECFMFARANQIELNLNYDNLGEDSKCKGWTITAGTSPCVLPFKEANRFGNKEGVIPPSCMIKITGNNAVNDFDMHLRSPVMLTGVSFCETQDDHRPSIIYIARTMNTSYLQLHGKPADILRRQIPNIVNAVSNAVNLANHIKAENLIASNTVDQILEEHPGQANRVSCFLSIIERNLTIDLLGVDTNNKFRKFCEVLKKQHQPELDVIADQMLSTFTCS